jgi:hypothetical protein
LYFTSQVRKFIRDSVKINKLNMAIKVSKKKGPGDPKPGDVEKNPNGKGYKVSMLPQDRGKKRYYLDSTYLANYGGAAGEAIRQMAPAMKGTRNAKDMDNLLLSHSKQPTETLRKLDSAYQVAKRIRVDSARKEATRKRR